MELKSLLLHLDNILRILINLNVWIVYIIQEFHKPPHRSSCWQTPCEKPQGPVGMHGSRSQKSWSQHLFVLQPALWKLDIFCSEENSLCCSPSFSLNISFNVNANAYRKCMECEATALGNCWEMTPWAPASVVCRTTVHHVTVAF